MTIRLIEKMLHHWVDSHDGRFHRYILHSHRIEEQIHDYSRQEKV
ncbi:MAG TPA: hypothetical protein VLA84_13590 [Microcoleus sp.]|nr:hypothetical protein [Microcoleus sp.]